MNLPEIAIYNFSEKTDDEVQTVVRAVNRQVLEDFLPTWGAGYYSRLKNLGVDPLDPEKIVDETVTADAAIYVVDEAHLAGAAGYHWKNGREVPYGFVFIETGDWTVTFSHEVLELIVDPMVNVFVPGPDPRPGGDGEVLHSYEVCDAVERFAYKIDGIEVSNFVTPQYFSEGDARGTRNDFLGVGVPSFGVMPGCHLGFIDLHAGQYVMYTQPYAADAALANVPRARAKGLRSGVSASQRVPDRLPELVEACATTCGDGPNQVVRRSLRRNAYQETAGGILKALRRE